MKIKITLCVLLVLLTAFGGVSNNEYTVAEIPEELLEGALAIVRYSKRTFRVNSESSASLSVKKAITILSDKADEYAIVNLVYDKFNVIGNLSVRLYDKDGKLIRKVRNQEIEDYSSFDGYSVFADNRQKYYKPNVASYPYTIEYEYDYIYKGLLQYPAWQPVNRYDLAVQKSEYEIITPSDFKIRLFESNLYDEGIRYTKDELNYYCWQVSDIRAIEDEAFNPYLFEFTPVVYAAPNVFEISGYKGNMETWSGFGSWIFKLMEDRDNLSSETLEILKKLEAESVDQTDLIRKVYEFVQKNTRYVSIQLGIGSWQPMSATEVENTGYGDCKALTNYTYALLKALGIKSYYSIVRAGESVPDINKDFVSNQSNHVILCVPQMNDTIWLECTSQTSPFGYIGSFTSDRYALLVKDDGGILVRTRKYKQSENLQVINAIVDIKSGEESYADIEIVCSGLQYETFSHLLHKSPDDIAKWIYNNTEINNIDLNSYDIAQKGSVDPEIRLKEELRIQHYTAETGERLFLPMNLLNRIDYVPPRIKDRKTSVVRRYPYIDFDTIKYIIPDDYMIEALPKDLKYETVFGDYIATFNVDDDTIIYTRKVVMNEGIFEPSEYDVLRNFCRDISKADNAKAVLVRTDD